MVLQKGWLSKDFIYPFLSSPICIPRSFHTTITIIVAGNDVFLYANCQIGSSAHSTFMAKSQGASLERCIIWQRYPTVLYDLDEQCTWPEISVISSVKHVKGQWDSKIFVHAPCRGRHCDWVRLRPRMHGSTWCMYCSTCVHVHGDVVDLCACTGPERVFL